MLSLDSRGLSSHFWILIGSRIGGSRADLGALAQEIVEDLKVTFEPFRAIADNLGADVLTDKDQ
jgi:hypothetical protein